MLCGVQPLDLSGEQLGLLGQLPREVHGRLVDGVNDTATDEKIARTRAAIVVREGRLISWDREGRPWTYDARGELIAFEPARV